MKPEIKKRVEMIRRGEVPPGYKKTKVGIIPAEWEVEEFEKYIEKSFYGTSKATNVEKGYPVLRMGNLSDGKIKINNLVYIELSVNDFKKQKLEKGDILLNRTNSYDLVGKISLFNLDGNYLTASYLVVFRPNKKKVNSEFLNHYLNMEKTQGKIKELATKGVSQVNINPTSFCKRINIPLLKLNEQLSIAEIISCWDKAIEKQEKLIELKKEQKNGLAFKLLTGKIRINGFKSKWPKMSMSDCFERINEKNHENNNNILTISAQRGLISQEHYFSKQIASESLLRYCLLKKGDYAYNKSYSIGYPFGAIKRLENFEKGIVSPLYICFRIKTDNFSNDYFKQYFDSGFLNEEIQKIAQEGARNHGLLNVSVEEFFQIIIRIPEDIKEQKAIAEILTTADKEIELMKKNWI